MKKRFLSYGAGMQTFALLVMAEKGDLEIDEVIFADTGAEHPETYEHIEKVAKPICERVGIPFVAVRMRKEVDDISMLGRGQLEDYKRMLESTSKLKSQAERRHAHREYVIQHNIPRKIVTSLRDEIIARRRVPSINPSTRWCTSDAKIIPIYRDYIRSAQERGEYVKPAIAVIGLGYEELFRMYKPHLSEYTVEYPLIQRKMKRKDCIEYIKRNGYEVPPKSGCYFCPFQGVKEWADLRNKHPDLFEDAMRLEEMDMNYPSYGLFPKKGWTLRRLNGYLSNMVQTTLLDEDYREEMQCEQAGYCGL